jgi:hypothetical protein
MSNLVMKVVGPDMRSYGGFLWPESGYVEAPDWDPQPACGRGLHGWLNGQGDYTCQSFTEIDGAKWLILEVDNFIDLVGKVKFQSCTVVHCGTRQTATNYLLQAGISGPIIGVTVSGGPNSRVSGGDGSTVSGGPNSRVSGGYGSTVSGGYGSTVSGVDGSTVVGGYGSTVVGGYGSTVRGGPNSRVSGGDGSTVVGGYGSTVSGGDGSTVVGGYGSTVVGGYGSTVSGGDGSTVSGGPNSRVSGGDGSTVSGGTGSVLILRDCNYSPKTATVGENGILPDTPYILKDGVFTRV